MVTGNHASVHFTQLWAAFCTQCRGKWATPVKCTAGGRIQGGRKLSPKRNARQAIFRIDDGRRGQQRPGIGMARSSENDRLCALLDRTAEIHDHHLVGDVADHATDRVR